MYTSVRVPAFFPLLVLWWNLGFEAPTIPAHFLSLSVTISHGFKIRTPSLLFYYYSYILVAEYFMNRQVVLLRFKLQLSIHKLLHPQLSDG
jgi:hypothetical protein